MNIEAKINAPETIKTPADEAAMETFELILEGNSKVPQTHGVIRTFGALGILKHSVTGVSYTDLHTSFTRHKASFAGQMMEKRAGIHKLLKVASDRSSDVEQNSVQGALMAFLHMAKEGSVVLLENLQQQMSDVEVDVLEAKAIEILQLAHDVLVSPEMDEARKEYWEGVIAYHKGTEPKQSPTPNQLGYVLQTEWLRQCEKDPRFQEIVMQDSKNLDPIPVLQKITSAAPAIS